MNNEIRLNQAGHMVIKWYFELNKKYPGIVQWFKTMTTNEYIRNVNQHQWKPFNKKLWQRNYYERIIRNEKELNIKRQYIINNPMKWIEDENNPANKNTVKPQNRRRE